MAEWSMQSGAVLNNLRQIYISENEIRQSYKQGNNNNGNKENVTVVWFDPYCLNKKILTQRQKKIRTVNDYILLYSNLNECIARLEQIKKEKILLIVASKCIANILPRLDKIRQVDAVFIFSSVASAHQYKNIPNSAGVFTKYADLIIALRQHIMIVNNQLQIFSFYQDHQRYVRNLTAQSASFLWFHVFKEIVIHLQYSETARQEMLDAARRYYRGNQFELRQINEFEKTYRPEDAIKWYTKNSFVYRLVNKALRTEDVEQLHTFRYFIGDLCTALTVEHNVIRQLGDSVTVYRGLRLTQLEFDVLVRDQKQLISMNGFVSTSLTRTVAEMYAGKPTTDKLSVVLEITCDVERLGNSVVFAFIGATSYFKDENEVLFDIGATFRFDSVSQDASTEIWYVKMIATDEGLATLHNYKKEILNQEKITSPKIMYGILLFDMGNYSSSSSYFEQLVASPEGEDMPILLIHLGRALGAQGAHEKEWMHYEQAYKLLTDAPSPEFTKIAHTLVQMGLRCFNADEIDRALDYLNRALLLFEQHFDGSHPILASTLRLIGSCHNVNGDYEQAWSFYGRALQIYEPSSNSNHIGICDDLLEIGRFCRFQGKYDEALGHFQRILDIRMQTLPSAHPDIADCLLLIGETLNDQEHHLGALLFLKKAWKMYNNVLPLSELDQRSAVLHGIGSAYYGFGSFRDALKYYRRSWKMKTKYLNWNHRDMSCVLDNIGNAYSGLCRHAEALKYALKALSIRKQKKNHHHLEIADSFINVGRSYMDIGKLKQAMRYFVRARAIYTEIHPQKIEKAKKNELQKCILRLKKRIQKAKRRKKWIVKQKAIIARLN